MKGSLGNLRNATEEVLNAVKAVIVALKLGEMWIEVVPDNIICKYLEPLEQKAEGEGDPGRPGQSGAEEEGQREG